jgi:hypothetical protein
MASRGNTRLDRRLAVVTDAVRQSVAYREELRDLAKAYATVRAALAVADIEPTTVAMLRRGTDPERRLSERGEAPQLQQADAAFVAEDPELSQRESNTERWARHRPDVAGEPPTGFGDSLSDWYAWSLAVLKGAEAATEPSSPSPP